MTPAPPRRPRRWWTVLVQSAICVGLAAMVSWPERQTDLFSGAYMTGGRVLVGCAEVPGVRDPSVSFFLPRARGKLEPLSIEVQAAALRNGLGEVWWRSHASRLVTVGPVSRWRYRDAGLHVLLGDALE